MGAKQWSNYTNVYYISPVYSLFSDRVGLPLQECSEMKSIGTEFLQPDALPGMGYINKEF